MSLGEAAIVRLPVVGDRLYEWALPRKNQEFPQNLNA